MQGDGLVDCYNWWEVIKACTGKIARVGGYQGRRRIKKWKEFRMMVTVSCETRYMLVLVTLKNWIRCVDLTCGWFCLPGDIWQCLKIFLVVTVWTGLGLYWHLSGRGWGGCSVPYRAHKKPLQQRTIPPLSARLRKMEARFSHFGREIRC